MHQSQENEGWANLPKQRTVYYHLKEGVIVLPKGKLRYCPRKTKRRHIPMRAKVLSERTSIEDHPPEINGRERMGDWEMDCVVSGRSGKGGLLVMVDRRRSTAANGWAIGRWTASSRGAPAKAAFSSWSTGIPATPCCAAFPPSRRRPSSTRSARWCAKAP